MSHTFFLKSIQKERYSWRKKIERKGGIWTYLDSFMWLAQLPRENHLCSVLCNSAGGWKHWWASLNNSLDPCNRCTLQGRVEKRKGGGPKQESDGRFYQVNEMLRSCYNKPRYHLVHSLWLSVSVFVKRSGSTNTAVMFGGFLAEREIHFNTSFPAF